MWNPFDFTERRIIVAGATSGIGRATAIKLSQQGASLILLGRNEDKLQRVISELSGSDNQYYVKDFSNSNNYRDLFDLIISDGKKIDGLVYSAGIARILPATLLNKKTMDESMTTNFYSFIEMIGTLSKKKYHNRASIVGVSSISAFYPQKCQGMYVATKAAMNSMVSSLAIELAEKGMRINTVLPASTNTQMYKEAIEGKTESEVAHLVSRQVLGIIEPDDIADVIMFLLSDASKMITGRTIFADGGYLNF